jgi:ATP-dependent Clp protease ATP-binding subunit ClpB
MTSNIGSQFLADGIDEDIAGERVMGALRDHFRPEFLNRVDEIVLFQRLGREQLAEIVELQVARLRERLAERGVELELTPGATELLAREGYDPAYGARPLKRLVQRRIENPLAQRLLAGEVRDGDRVIADAEGEELTFAVAEPAVR